MLNPLQNVKTGHGRETVRYDIKNRRTRLSNAKTSMRVEKICFTEIAIRASIWNSFRGVV